MPITHAGGRPIVADPTRVMISKRGQRERRDRSTDGWQTSAVMMAIDYKRR